MTTAACWAIQGQMDENPDLPHKSNLSDTHQVKILEIFVFKKSRKQKYDILLSCAHNSAATPPKKYES